uniref:(northern house mosquito) hypothetical protein n=1 Tax=Culex pipiens TaxID=7175 RepID=A0A8D8CVS9_CULPI
MFVMDPFELLQLQVFFIILLLVTGSHFLGNLPSSGDLHDLLPVDIQQLLLAVDLLLQIIQPGTDLLGVLFILLQPMVQLSNLFFELVLHPQQVSLKGLLEPLQQRVILLQHPRLVHDRRIKLIRLDTDRSWVLLGIHS